MFELKRIYALFRGSILKWFRFLKLQQYILPTHKSSTESVAKEGFCNGLKSFDCFIPRSRDNRAVVFKYKGGLKN